MLKKKEKKSNICLLEEWKAKTKKWWVVKLKGKERMIEQKEKIWIKRKRALRGKNCEKKHCYLIRKKERDRW